MSKELVIGANRHETKVAILEEDQLVEVYFQRANEYSLAGSIHKGRVTRVLPGMQSAFVDLGLERDTFLYVSDFFEENEDIDTVTEDKPPAAAPRSDRRDRNDRGDRNERSDRGDRGDRGQNRFAERSPEAAVLPEAREQRAPVAERVPVSEPSIVSPIESPIETPAAEAVTGVQLVERGQPDRGAFQGERRGRRSRRRRSRGHGFPETKYAQPGGPSTERAAPPADGADEDEADVAEVIVLPGESLAKYRHVPEVSHASAGPKEELFAATPETGFEEEPEYDPQEDLEAEAEEIELTDKIFSHQEISEEAEEEKIDQVRDDQPESDFLVADVEAEDFEEIDTPKAEEATTAAGITLSQAAVIEQGELPSFSSASFSEIERAEKLADSLDEEQFGSEASRVELFEAEEFEGQEAGSEAEDQSSTLHDASAVEAGLPETTESGSGQSAVLREQGGRNMYRTSRRMRRRRGGSGGRFNSEGPKVENSPEFVSGGGAAPAVQPAARPEPRREFDEERPERPDRVMPSISDLLKAGQEIIVQIAKEPLGQKGARITSHIALPGRYVVFMPSVTHLGVSRKVGSDEERQRLKRILQTHRVGTSGGFIVRTAGEGVPEEEIAADMNFLYSLWLDIRQKAEKRPAPALLHYDLDIVQRILRDQVTEEFKAIWVDNEEMYESVLIFLQRFQPALVSRVKMYTRTAPIFDAFNITQELEKALRPKVWLKSGGYIVINQTEALVAIDINTGKYVGKSNRLEDTIVKTNTEAVKEIVRQIRLRDLGGIIVVDFIDMDERKNRQKVMQALEEAMQADRAPYKILQFNDFGLVAITRKRVKQSLERTLCAPCPHCEGAGYVKSVQTIVGEILVEAQKIARAIEGKDVVLRANPEVAKLIKASSNRYLEELEETLGRPVLVVSDASLHSEKFDLA